MATDQSSGSDAAAKPRGLSATQILTELQVQLASRHIACELSSSGDRLGFSLPNADETKALDRDSDLGIAFGIEVYVSPGLLQSPAYTLSLSIDSMLFSSDEGIMETISVLSIIEWVRTYFIQNTDMFGDYSGPNLSIEATYLSEAIGEGITFSVDVTVRWRDFTVARKSMLNEYAVQIERLLRLAERFDSVAYLLFNPDYR